MTELMFLNCYSIQYFYSFYFHYIQLDLSGMTSQHHSFLIGRKENRLVKHSSEEIKKIVWKYRHGMEHGMILIAHLYGAMFVKNYKVSGGYQVFFMVFNATFNNILVILWRSVLLVEETGENH